MWGKVRKCWSKLRERNMFNVNRWLRHVESIYRLQNKPTVKPVVVLMTTAWRLRRSCFSISHCLYVDMHHLGEAATFYTRLSEMLKGLQEVQMTRGGDGESSDVRMSWLRRDARQRHLVSAIQMCGQARPKKKKKRCEAWRLVGVTTFGGDSGTAGSPVGTRQLLPVFATALFVFTADNGTLCRDNNNSYCISGEYFCFINN